MPVYTVHEPPLRWGESRPDPERFVFVRDGFSFAAFLFGPLWMLWHRMWLVFFGYVIAAGGFEAVLTQLRASTGLRVAIGLLIALLTGFEAPTLRRFTLARRKWSNVGLIVGDNLESAEQRFFDAWTKAGGTPVRLAEAAASAHDPGEPDIVGLFPEPGGNR
ncbi:MAG TPA: DUF2628 domain-containing protein [Xanthobacteraceae bacterium]|jgi:hypothetical protein